MSIGVSADAKNFDFTGVFTARWLFDRIGWLTFIVAACSILYELILAHTLALLAANTVIWYSLVVGFFLLGMGLGAAFDSKFLAQRNSWRKFVLVEMLLSLTGAFSVLIIHFFHSFFLYGYAWGSGVFHAMLFFGIAVFLALAIGLLTGIELPVLMALAQERHGEDNVSRILGWDYLGSLVGALAFPFFVLPVFEMPLAVTVVASVNLAVATITLLRCTDWKRWSGFALLAIALGQGIFFVQIWTNRQQVEQFFLQQYYFFMEKSDEISQMVELSEDFPDIERSSSAYQKIDIMKDVTREPDEFLIRAYSDKLKLEEEYPRDVMLFLNGDFQINTTFDEVYHEYFAHLPISMRGEVPQRTLVLGGGDGLLIYELLKYSGMSIEHVDLDRELVRLAKTHPVLTAANRNAMNNPRIQTQFGDGYHFIRTTDKKYDAIYVDFPAAVDYNLAKLYSREFFNFIRARLEPGGFMVFDATGIGLLSLPADDGSQDITPDNSWPIYYHTLKAAGFKDIQPYITTLEIENDQILPELKRGGMNVSMQDELQEILQQVDTQYERQALKHVFYDQVSSELAKEFVLGLQQGFIAVANEENTFSKRYHDFGIETYVYNESRFHLAFNVRFPQDEDTDWSKVNSILRPTFPDGSIWIPRVPF